MLILKKTGYYSIQEWPLIPGTYSATFHFYDNTRSYHPVVSDRHTSYQNFINWVIGWED